MVNLKMRREELHMTPSEAAEKCNISLSAYQKVEESNNFEEVSFKVIAKISQVLNIYIGDLLKVVYKNKPEMSVAVYPFEYSLRSFLNKGKVYSSDSNYLSKSDNKNALCKKILKELVGNAEANSVKTFGIKEARFSSPFIPTKAFGYIIIEEYNVLISIAVATNHLGIYFGHIKNGLVHDAYDLNSIETNHNKCVLEVVGGTLRSMMDSDGISRYNLFELVLIKLLEYLNYLCKKEKIPKLNSDIRVCNDDIPDFPLKGQF